MFQRIKSGTIVVGVDGSTSSTHALAWAVEHAAAERRALTLVTTTRALTPAYTDDALVYPHETRADLEAQGRGLLSVARELVRTKAPDLEVSEVFRFADPREVLLAMSEDAAMVVLGSRGRGPLRSLLLGSVGVALVRHARCPVVVHRPGNAGNVKNGVVVGADATEESRPVLEFAYREASLRDLPLSVVHCYWDMQGGTLGASAQPISESEREAARLEFAESVAGLQEKYPDVTVSIRTSLGRPQDVLVRLGEKMNLIVVGAHQAARLEEVVFGSVSVAVVEHATCPVAIVPISTPQ